MDFTWILLLAVFFVIYIVIFRTPRQEKKEVTYVQVGALFTPAERSFYGVLDQAISNDYKIFGKVRVADVIKPNPKMNKSDWQTAFNKISSKHFDYVLCEKDTLNVIAVIELDDKSHNNKRVKERDIFLEGACKDANLKLVRFKVKKSYQVNDIRKHIKEEIGIVQSEINEPGVVGKDKTAKLDENNNVLCELEIKKKYGRLS